MAKKQHHYFLCINNDGYPAALEPRKVYVSLPDKMAEAKGYLRVIDESGEDYLYPASRFVAIELPREAKSVFADVA